MLRKLIAIACLLTVVCSCGAKRVFTANFDQDTIGQPPSVDPPEDPAGDSIESHNAIIKLRKSGTAPDETESRFVDVSGGPTGGHLTCTAIPTGAVAPPGGVLSIKFDLAWATDLGDLVIRAKSETGTLLSSVRIEDGLMMSGRNEKPIFDLRRGVWTSIVWVLDYEDDQERFVVGDGDQLVEARFPWKRAQVVGGIAGPRGPFQQLKFSFAPDPVAFEAIWMETLAIWYED